jgi:hypothetical protein
MGKSPWVHQACVNIGSDPCAMAQKIYGLLSAIYTVTAKDDAA